MKIAQKFWTKRTKQILIKAIILVIAAVFLTWLLEYRHFINDAPRVWQLIREKPKVFFYNSLVMFCIEMMFYGIIRKPFTTVSVMTALVLVVGYIHISKFNFRGTPLLPEDFQLGSQFGTLTKFVDVWGIVRLVLAVIMVIIVGIILERATEKWLKKEAQAPSNIWWRRYRVVSRVAIVALAMVGFMWSTDFARHHENAREIKLPWLETKFTDWNQVRNYEETGFILGFLYNTGKFEPGEPAGYSAEKIAEIKQDLETQKATDTGRKTLNAAGYNIVLILDESFIDPENIREYYQYTGGDVTPNLHRLQKTVMSGEMFSPDYGGGTANIEFEVLTGLTNYFLKTVPYTNLLPRQKSVPSLINFVKENSDYGATAIHPFNGGMYKRDIVYPRMGFDEFISEQDFFHTEKDGESEYINDRSSYQEMFDVLSSSDEPQIVSLITMQNHAPYNKDEYGESKFKVTNITDEGQKDAVETYLMTAHLSDKYLGELYDKLQKFEENTVILLFGDHSPGIFPDVIESNDHNISSQARKTPYLIMSNFEIKTDSKDLPTTTPNCLTNTLFNKLNLEKPSWYYLLDTVCKDEPILTEAYFDNTAPFMSSALSSYELLSFDFTAGKQYFAK